VQNPQFCLIRWRVGWCLARLLVLLPGRFLALGGAKVALFAPGARFCRDGLAHVALASRFLHHVIYFNQLSLVVLHVLDERASGVVGAEDLLVDELLGEVLSEEGGEGGGGDVGGGEAEDVSDLFACVVIASKSSKTSVCWPFSKHSAKRRWVPMDHSKSKKHEGVAVYLAIASNCLKKIRIVVFEHFTHQLVIVLVEELVTVCIRS